ncbi:hypothetical protein Y695_04645 [Hydrogenophaga sp. T4]|nr:hypothetical protein Y695_04645 [Hydrogenophaga sp. T4]
MGFDAVVTGFMRLIVSKINAYTTVMEQPMSANDNLETWLAQEQEIQQRLAAGPGPVWPDPNRSPARPVWK